MTILFILILSLPLFSIQFHTYYQSDDIGEIEVLNDFIEDKNIPITLDVQKPVPFSILKENDIILSGYTKPDAMVIVNNVLTDVADSVGKFEIPVFLNDGKHEIEIVVIDSFNNRYIKKLPVTIDNTPPATGSGLNSDTLYLHKPYYEMYYLLSPDLTIYVDGLRIPFKNGIFNYYYGLKPGKNIINFEVVDVYENKRVVNKTVVYDTHAPTVEIYYIKRNPDSEIVYYISCMDTHSGISHVELKNKILDITDFVDFKITLLKTEQILNKKLYVYDKAKNTTVIDLPVKKPAIYIGDNLVAYYKKM